VGEKILLCDERNSDGRNYMTNQFGGGKDEITQEFSQSLIFLQQKYFQQVSILGCDFSHRHSYQNSPALVVGCLN